LLYGSDRPVVEPGVFGMPEALDWEPVIDGTRRALGTPSSLKGLVAR